MAAYELGVSVDDIFSWQKSRRVPKKVQNLFSKAIPRITNQRIKTDKLTDHMRRVI